MLKSIKSIYVSSELVLEVQQRGLKFSALIENLLRAYLDAPIDKDEEGLEEQRSIEKMSIEEVKLLEKLTEIKKQRKNLADKIDMEKNKVEEKKRKDEAEEKKGWMPMNKLPDPI